MNHTSTSRADRPGLFSNDAERWDAVVRRDHNADDKFFYGVATTGIFCRPSCPSRLAHRKNVRFYATVTEAEHAGFRPCRRCRPTEPSLAAHHADLISAACHTIENAESVPTLDILARASGLSRYHFHRLFKALTGVTPRLYATEYRAQRLRQQLAAHKGTVTDAIYEAGFSSSGRFYAGSTQALGMRPSRYRVGGAGVAIRFAVGECSLGSLLVAATAEGVCAISLGDDAGKLVHDLQDQFPNADLIGGDGDFERLVARVVGFIEFPGLGLDLPLDIRGTAFQQRVWQALRKIPAGDTATYTDIARQIGSPTAVRAVARACASNTLAVAIPCHRVVRTDGSLSGYRWGVDRKRILIERESSQRANADHDG